jgi:hypothetical protein
MAHQMTTLGTEHPDLAQSFMSLAGLYRTKGDYDKAEPLYLHALEILAGTLGPEHPAVAGVLNNLAVLYELLHATLQCAHVIMCSRELLTKQPPLAKTTAIGDELGTIEMQPVNEELPLKRARASGRPPRRGRRLDGRATGSGAWSGISQQVNPAKRSTRSG